MSELKNINVNIPNVVAWFEESEQCMLHNHAKLIPNSLDDPIKRIIKILTQKANEAEQLKDAAEADGNGNYYYWDGYLTALDFAIDSFPEGDFHE
ncbi:hypothetical protein [Flavobacterium sp.]|uniref:hypothetical protein n=1 Tax=Flavobacterium sp. TaxID=239 RepID=UPI003BEE7B95